MGDLYHLHCEKCGFKKHEITIGIGMAGLEFDYVAAPCYKCKKIRIFNRMEEEIRCKRCRTELTSYKFNKSDYEHEDIPEKWSIPCPACHSDLFVAGLGFWD